ncbi:uncharacterized protein LOC119003533 isoform X2 [Sturnira hondurensis]|uniref:uncharacterized protein LOC119003533 isoform X2 n=1 Tax=Sturnira hondurensis TaxID=192404 RepID=UPI00187AF2E7|nr:uncharacterized protein LOC119003533 isoform X2 [Sturnira hondurensis]
MGLPGNDSVACSYDNSNNKTISPINHLGSESTKCSLRSWLLTAPRERRKENMKPEELPEGQARPRGQVLQQGTGAQIPEDNTEEAGGDKPTEEGPPLSKTEPGKDAKDWKLPMPLEPVYPPSASSLSTNAVGRSWELSPPIAKSSRIHNGPFWDFLDMKMEKRLACRKERRSRCGDINVHKRYQLGQVFTPFQALATTEMQRLVCPRVLPMIPHMHKMGILCTNERNLQDLSLSSTELGLGKDDNSHEKEKSASLIKVPLFPPIDKAAKYNNMK